MFDRYFAAYSWPTSAFRLSNMSGLPSIVKMGKSTFYMDQWNKQGNFRLHPSGPLGISLGCITLQHRTDFLAIRQALVSYPASQVS